MTAEPIRTDELPDLLARFADSLVQLNAAPDDLELQRQVCLASRSGYTAFYASSMLRGEVDAAARMQLGDLLKQAVSVLPEAGKGSKYRQSVMWRLQEFTKFCSESNVSYEGDTTSMPDFAAELAAF